MKNFLLHLNLRSTAGIWIIMSLLAFVGLLAVYSSAARIGNATPQEYLTKQFFFIMLGFALCYAISRAPLTLFNSVAEYFFWSITILWWIMQFWSWTQGVFSPRTVHIPFVGSFQPAEFAKVASIMYLAYILAINQDTIRTFKTVLKKIILPFAAIGAPIFFSNFSTFALIALTCALIMWLGNVRTRHLVLLGIIMIIILRLGMLVAHVTIDQNTKVRRHGEKPNSFLLKTESFVRHTRLATMDTRWNEFKERLFESKTSQIKTKSAPKDFEQIDYAHLAIAAGTLLPNKGPGNSQIKYILPQSFSDFIFAVVVEEYGVLVSVVLVLLMFFIVLPWRIGMYIKRSKNMFATLLMIGMGLLLTMQALAHVGVCVELLPVTGQNLPLISHGGSSMISTCIMFGLIMNVMNYISKTEYNEKYTTPESSTSEQKEDK